MTVQRSAPRRRSTPPILARPGLLRRVPFLVLAAIINIGLSWLPLVVHADPAAPDADASHPAAMGSRILLPMIQAETSETMTGASYATIPVPPPPTDRPADKHGDLNLALRGYAATAAPKTLVDYTGSADGTAPQMPGIFSDSRTPRFTSVYRVNNWDWGCGVDGCRGAPLTDYPVTLLGMATSPGELLAAPRRPAEIYGGGYVALVLYAEPTRLTLKYTREDNVVTGYTVHLEKLTVDPKLVDLYRQANAAGRLELPALKNGQPLGLASGGEVLVAIRDCGRFMDPRSRKDWWQGR